MKLYFEKPGDHEKMLRKFFKQFDLPQDIEPLNQPICIMVFINRSGSSLVCERMRSTGYFTGFGEPLNHDLVIGRAEKLGIDSFGEYLRWLYENVRRENTMFGMKASVDQVIMLLRAGAIPRLFNDVRWVAIQRSDMVSQAVSFSIAAQTKQWTSFHEAQNVEPKYYFKDIKNRIDAISKAYASMHALFSVLEIDPYQINYEQFIKDPDLGAREFAKHLGFPDIEIDQSKLRMEKQGDSLNASFREKFLADYRASLLPGEIQ